MDNPYYGEPIKKTPPSLVTVENGFTFQGDMDDSDLSSLNTTPRKQEQRKSILTRGRLSPDQIEQADLGISLSKANRRDPKRAADDINTPRKSHSWNPPSQQQGNMQEQQPPLQVVQVAAGDRPRNSGMMVSDDPRVSKEEENVPARGRSRDEKLRDRKEKYRRMAFPSSRRVRPSGGVLNSWKKKANQRQEKAEKERVKPWYVPALGEDDDELMGGGERHEEGVSIRQDEDDDDDDISPMKATKHTFEDQAEEEEEEEEEEEPTTEEVIQEYKALASARSNTKEKPNDRAIVASKSKFTVERNESPTPKVDMYGCPIFSVDSEGSEDDSLTETKAKLDKLDTTFENEEQDDSIKAMLSSASFFSKSAAQTLADPTTEITNFLGNAAQGVEALVLGPLEEGDEEEKGEEDNDDSSQEPPPPPPRRRGRSPTAAKDATNSAAKRIHQPEVHQPEESVLESASFAARRIIQEDASAADNASFVLDDKSEVDVPAVLGHSNMTSHYVLDDLAAMEKMNEANDKLTKTNEQVKVEKEKPFVKVQEPDEEAVGVEEPDVKAQEPNEEAVDVEKPFLKAVDVSSDSDLFVEDEKITSIEDEIDAAIEVMDTIRVKEEVERLETLHAAKAAEALKVPVVSASSAEAVPEDEITEEAALEEKVPEPGPVDESKAANGVPLDESESAKVVPIDETPDVESPYEKSRALLDDEPSEAVPVNESSESLPPYQASSEALTPDQASAAVLADDVSATPDKVAPATSASDDESAQNGAVAAAVVGAVGAANVVTVAVTPNKTEIERDPGQLVIAASNGHAEEEEAEEEEPEFPPTDDADVDRIDFDTISVHSDGTPVQGNLDDTKQEATKKKKEAEKEPAKKSPVPEPAAPPEAAPETPEAKATKKKSKRDTASIRNKRSPQVVARKDASASSADAAAPKPAMVKTLDDNNGIAKGDIVLSLLNTNLSEANRAPKGSDQVRDAILRMRDMRKRQEKVELPEHENEDLAISPSDDVESSKRSALPVDVDDMRVVGAFDHVKELEEDAIEHLKHDEFEAALELYEEIVTIYAEAFKETAKKRKKKDKNDHKAYIGAALHNIGILHLLRFDFEEALSFFEKAADNRKEHFGAGTVDHLASLGKIALCHYAMDEYDTAHKSLEGVLELSKNHLAGLTDFMQVAEVLNNLGCLSFMCGQSEAAMTMFKECLDIQTSVLKQSLYSAPKFAGQSTSLNISVTRGNIGYVQMLTKKAELAIVEFEASLMHQQMILGDAHDTLICSMDHLAVANLLAKNKEEAIKMLGRMLRAQLAVYGALDERCILTLSKLQLVQTEETDYLEKALEQLWDQHSTSASPSSKAARVATSKKSNRMMKKLSFRKKAAKLNN